MVGRAFTLRFVPAREDLATPASWASPISTRAAIEAMPEGCVAVVDAAGVGDAGIFGDILCARMARRGVAALVTDGAVRDLEGVLGTGLPVWCRGAAAPPSVAGLTFVGWQEPVGCGGVAVFPDDVIVADRDGAVVVPQALLAEVLAEAPEQERMEAWIMEEVGRGAELPGLYPMNAETRARYEAERGAVTARAQGARSRPASTATVAVARMSAAEKPARMSNAAGLDPPGAPLGVVEGEVARGEGDRPPRGPRRARRRSFAKAFSSLRGRGSVLSGSADVDLQDGRAGAGAGVAQGGADGDAVAGGLRRRSRRASKVV